MFGCLNTRVWQRVIGIVNFKVVVAKHTTTYYILYCNTQQIFCITNDTLYPLVVFQLQTFF